MFIRRDAARRLIGWLQARHCQAASAHAKSTGASVPAAGGPAGGETLLARHAALVGGGVLQPDARQAAVVTRLASLLDDLQSYTMRMAEYKSQLAAYKVRGRRAAVAMQEPLTPHKLHAAIASTEHMAPPATLHA